MLVGFTATDPPLTLTMAKPSPPSLSLRPCDHAQAPLAPVMDRIRLHAAVLEQVRGLLPPHLAEHCRDCVVGSGQRLMVYVDGPAWCFQLRFHAPTVLERMKEASGRAFRTLEFRSLPASETPARSGPGPSVSEATARMVTESGKGVGSKELAMALDRLGRTLAARAGGNG